MAKSSAAELVDTIAAMQRLASMQSLDLSFNELLDMHQASELDIAPDYQRLFRWTEGQRSRFVESLLLDMPVPPIFVVEAEDSRYQLIDGLQRISSYLHLRGELVAPHLPAPVYAGDKLTLSECDIIPALNGMTFDDFPTSLQIRLKRAFIRVEVVRKGADPHFKYHMFKRLNTGGDLLSSQQLRNCTIRMLDTRFPDFIIDMASTEDFMACTTGLSDERRLSAYDQELVLRFFAFKDRRDRFKHDVSDFLTEYMEDVADPKKPNIFDYAAEEENFRRTFEALQKALKEYAFSFSRNKRLSAGFSIYHFEAFTLGLQVVLDQLDLNDGATITKLKNVLERIKHDADFIRITTGGGKNSPGPLNQRISFVEDRLRNAFA